jgi:hypothetical protein
VVLFVALFPSLVSSRSLLRAALLFGYAFPKEEKVAKRIAEEKFFHSPGLRREWRLNSTSWQILLIQRLNIGHANPTDIVTFGNIEVQTDPISFDNGKLPVTIVGRKAKLSIKGQRLLHISDRKTRSN